MARTGRGWDAKPPAPKRRPPTSSGGGDPDLPAGDKPSAYRGRSLPWSNHDDAGDLGAGPPGVGGDLEPYRGRSLPWSNRDGAGGLGASSPSADGDPEPAPYRGRSLPWSNADEARTAAMARERRSNRDGSGYRGQASGDVPGSADSDRGDGGQDDSPGGGRSGEWRAKQAGRRGARRRNAGEERERVEEARDPYEVAREICLRQLAARPRTRAELAAALKKRGVAEEVSAAVLDRYSEVGMIDDAAFAKAWVTSRHHSRGLASRALAQELRRKGVEQEVTESALSELDSETEAQTALDLALRKLRTTRGEPEAVFRRLVGMLARKGYPGGVAVRAVKEALATRDAELADLIDPDAYEETG